MEEIEFTVPKDGDLTAAPNVIESVCLDMGLSLTMKSSLSTHSGSLHWHFRKQKEKGTLELTVLPSSGRIWASIQSGRRAPWIYELLPKIRREVEGRMQTGDAAKGAG